MKGPLTPPLSPSGSGRDPHQREGEEAAREEPTTRWLVVWTLILAGVVAAFQIGKAPVALPALRAELGLGLVGAGWVVSMFNVLGALAGALIGAAGDQVGHRRAVLAGLVLSGAASAIGAAAPGAAVLLATRFLEGLGFMTTVTAAPALIARMTRRADQRLAFGFWSGYMPAGSALMMLASPPLLAASGWRGLWLVTAAFMLAAALLTAAATRGLSRAASKTTGGLTQAVGDIWRALRRPGPPALALAFGSYTLQYLAVLAFLPTLLVEEDGMSPGGAAVLTAIANAANMLGTFGGGWLLYKGAPRWAMIAAGSLIMGLLSVLIFTPALPFALRYGAVIAFTLLGGAVPPAVFSGAAQHAPAPELVGTTTGLVMQGSNLGQSIGPPALARLAAASGGWTWSPAVLLAAAAVGSALALLLRRLERRRGSELRP